MYYNGDVKTKTHRRYVWLEAEDIRYLNKWAKDEGVTFSELANRLIKEETAKEIRKLTNRSLRS
ncbi:MAG: hypothetical protein G01um101416_573 [Microgenomates group bacterium Gr01-1014_16]|nr:MAG: hypothetical protein G01um101416_573 [Microgenomates group bacterium Gr01-1014_16]